jgi:hypothetical protein
VGQPLPVRFGTMRTLSIRCGPTALASIRRDGLQANSIGVIPAAAGGPKGLALHGLDCALFGEWLPKQPRQRQLIGASVGAWRIAAAAQANPVEALTRFADLYCEQRYSAKPSSNEISTFCQRLIADLVSGHESEILNNPYHHINLLTVRGKQLLTKATPARTVIGFGAASIANTVSRRHLRHWLDRVWFYSTNGKIELLPLDDFQTDEVALSEQNLHDALLASGAIPMILNSVTGITDAPDGHYWDGGIIDYHLDLPYQRCDGLVLYPHFYDHIVPGWLDKYHKSRRARGANLDNVILISPSPDFIKTLPNQKLPDRKDFKRYGPRYQEERIRDWRYAVAESRRMGDEFLEIVRTGEIAALAREL